MENAKRRLMKSVNWRKENKIDSLSENPDIQKLSKIYKHYVDSVDKEGRPVLEFNGGRWDLRKIALSGNREEMQLLQLHARKGNGENPKPDCLNWKKHIRIYILVWPHWIHH